MNALLIRWKYGYTSVSTGAGDSWGYLELGSIETAAEAERLGLAELTRTAGPRDQISLGADPDPADPANAFGTGWDLGDYVIAPNRTGGTGPQRVLQNTVSEDDETAELTVVPELSALIDEREVRWQRTLNRMSNGTLGGSSAVASPIVTPEYIPARKPSTEVQTFSWPEEAILDYRTAPWTPEVNGRLAQMVLVRGRSSPEVSGDISGDLHVAFIVNGVTLDEGIIYDGYEEGVMGGSGVAFGPGDKLTLQPTTVPAGTKSLTARVTQTHYHG